ncbi:MAG: ATP-binding protein [Planctomycetaceae bacterium]
MSYRMVKRLFGETSLERKCRFLFGGGLMLLITGSFALYAHQNSKLVYDQKETVALSYVQPTLIVKHWQYFEPEESFRGVIEQMARDARPSGLPESSRPEVFPADLENAKPEARPIDDTPYKALAEIRQGAAKFIDIKEADGEYHYYAPIRAEPTCVALCHSTRNEAEGDLLGMVRIALPLADTRQALSFNNAILLATALVTAFLAMLAAWAIVRYVIVKPVLHLKDVSDQIARGKLDLRADIRTGDEFEELSHAFNRMLRHLVTVQDELREVNTDLDGKVDELAQVNLRLYEMNKLKDEFLATMSHELRTPLNSILGFSDVLAQADNLTDKQVRFVENILNSGKSLMVLINDLLDLAKIESGKMEVQPAELSLRDLVERQVATLLPLAQKKNIDLSHEVDPDLPLLWQDGTKLRQILDNLLSNAIKFTPEGGRVRVQATRIDDATLELVVEDSGIGIPLEDQEAIFEKFRQGRAIPGLRDTMTREYGGTGLGLSIVKELAKLLDGEVLLESEFGKGSTFIIRVPLQHDRDSGRFDDDGRSRELRRLTHRELQPAKE